MTDTPAAGPLPLGAAICAWCDQERVRSVQIAEVGFSDEAIISMGFAPLSAAQKRAEVQRKVGGVDPSRYGLESAWTALMLDLKQRIARGAIYLAGVQVEPEEHLEPERIPGVWAADYSINAAGSTVAGRNRRWLAVRASDKPFDGIADSVSPSRAVEQAGGATTPLRVEDIPAFTDDFILELLEEHARRVINGPDAKLLDAFKIKVSLMPILRRKMEHRFDTGETLPTLGKETAALKNWIATKVPSHQVPTAKSIANAIGSRYRPPKA